MTLDHIIVATMLDSVIYFETIVAFVIPLVTLWPFLVNGSAIIN